MTPSVAKEADTSLADDNRAYSDGRSRENKCGNGKGAETGDGEALRRDSYAMEVDRGRNFYACGRFGHMA